MEETLEAKIRIVNPEILKEPVRGQPLNLVLQFTNAANGDPLAVRRVGLDVSLHTITPDSLVPSGVQILDEDDYSKTVTDDQGRRTCRLVIKELSSKWKSDFYVRITVSGLVGELQTQNFRALSKKRAISEGSETSRPIKNRKLLSLIENLESRVKILEGLIENK